MSAQPMIVKGAVKPDGSLELEEPLKQSPGPVEVTVRPISTAPATETWWEHLQRLRSELEAMGYPFKSDVEMQAYIDELRSDDDRLEEVYREIEEARKRREQDRVEA